MVMMQFTIGFLIGLLIYIFQERRKDLRKIKKLEEKIQATREALLRSDKLDEKEKRTRTTKLNEIKECTRSGKGYFAGEVCNRNNCNGIIEERVIDIDCECIVDPQCRDCVDPLYYCPLCNWAKE